MRYMCMNVTENMCVYKMMDDEWTNIAKMYVYMLIRFFHDFVLSVCYNLV